MTIRQTSFHHRSDRAVSQGALFRMCRFEGVTLFRCDLVMSKLYECNFERCKITECDLRNVFWFDRFATKARMWEKLPRFKDPFATSNLKDTRFGHPVVNMMGVPLQMMIPESYTSVWEHMGLVQRRMLKIAYAMREEPKVAFGSAI
ncbi:pentapeptide repeat-containing protein [Roseivivax sp. CAU 1761]